MSYNTWSSSWGNSWDSSWGQPTEIAQAVSHSGVTRLWMYELYADSIEKDHKERGINQPEPVVAATPQTTVKSSKKQPQKRPKVKPQRSVTPKPLPVIARATPQGPSYMDFVEDMINNLPVLNTNVLKFAKKEKTEVSKQNVKLEDKVVKKKKQEEEWLLLLAA